MNVIKFDIEIKKGWFFADKKKSVKEQIVFAFEKELDFEGPFIDRLKEEWENIQLPSLKALNSSNFLVGFVTSKNIKIFLFEKNNTGLRGKNNIALEVIAYGDLPVEQILNESFTKIQSVNDNLKCNHINDTRIFIFPFDTSTRDIYNYELKVRAELKSPYNISKNDIFRWIFMFLIAAISSIIYFKIDNSKADPTQKEKNDAILNIFISICGSAIFYLISDAVLYFVIPFFKRRSHRNVQINNLSSVVEARTELPFNDDEELIIPE